MLLLCNGMPRSASTWSYNVAMALLRKDGVYGGYDENLYRFLCGLPASCVHAVLKCHSLDAAGLALAQLQAAKVIYTWRDLADATASYITMFDVDFEHTIALMSSRSASGLAQRNPSPRYALAALSIARTHNTERTLLQLYQQPARSRRFEHPIKQQQSEAYVYGVQCETPFKVHHRKSPPCQHLSHPLEGMSGGQSQREWTK